MSNSRLDDLLDLNEVLRWNSRVRLLRRQTVAEHTFNVMVIASEIVIHLDTTNTGFTTVDSRHRMMLRVLRWALVHDGPEAETGDINYLFKRVLDRRKIDELENVACPWYTVEVTDSATWAKSIVKIADKVEEYKYITKWCQPDEARKWVPGILDQIERHTRDAYIAFGWRNLFRIVQRVLDVPITALECEVESRSGNPDPSAAVDPVNKPVPYS